MTIVTLSLIIAVVLLAALLVYFLIRLQAVTARLLQVESRLASQQVSINGLTAGAVGVDNRLRGIEERESAIEHRQESIENQQSQGEAPFGEAIRLVQQGATAQRLVEELGLSQSEASLIHMIHGGN